MKKIIIADPDLNYALKLQAKFFQKLQDTYTIEVITKEDLINKFLKSPQTASCLIISEEWAGLNFSRHNIEKVFTLIEGNTNDAFELSRFSGIDEIFNKVRNEIGSETKSLSKDEATVLLFKSASGGTGKTVLSLALAEYLAKKYYKVLYVNTQSSQMFHYYLTDKTPINNSAAMSLQSNVNNAFERLNNQIRHDGFYYLLPFGMPLYSYNINKHVYINFIETAKASKFYDYVIVDSDNNMDEITIKLITIADKVLMVTLPGDDYKFALEQMLKKVNIKNKLISICNKVKDEHVETDEFINEWEKVIDEKSIHEFASLDDVQKIAILVS